MGCSVGSGDESDSEWRTGGAQLTSACSQFKAHEGVFGQNSDGGGQHPRLGSVEELTGKQLVEGKGNRDVRYQPRQ